MLSEVTNPGITTRAEKTASQSLESRRKPAAIPIRYGLPCANCRLYYGAELALCPICGCSDRISPQ
jgi:hypothetical protein